MFIYTCIYKYMNIHIYVYKNLYYAKMYHDNGIIVLTLQI